MGVASVLALATMVVVGWALVATGKDRLAETRKLLNRVALGSLSFAVMLRIGSWVFSPRGGKAPISEAVSVIAGAKWMVPFVIALIAGALALVVHETRRAIRRRRLARGEPVVEDGYEESAAEAVEDPVEH
nr:MAG: hypothetical protein DIU67_11150 [Actinomycetota bacterium]